jgi:pimeloyl-ACP methyl ester carboxylesterase
VETLCSIKEQIHYKSTYTCVAANAFDKVSIDSITNYEYIQTNKNHPTEFALLLVHGFGANHHHWRSNLPVLAQKYDTYAIDLFGFGNSSQHTEFPYTISFWSSQVLIFIDTVIQRPCILVGNSLGGYVIMKASTSAAAATKIIGIIPINPLVVSREGHSIKTPISTTWYHTKFLVTSYFHYIRQKLIIKKLLTRLYPVFPDRIDDFIIQSIYSAASTKNASDVFYKIMMENLVNPTVFIEDILPVMRVPMLVIYGEKDAWIRPSSTRKKLANYSKIEWKSVDAGHCPQDEIPDRINSLVLDFAAKIVT